MPERVFVKLVTPSEEGLSDQARMRTCNMGKEWRSPLKAFRKKLSGSWCPPAVWVSVGTREGAGGFTVIDAALATRVAWTTTFTMALMAMISVDAGGGADGA